MKANTSTPSSNTGPEQTPKHADGSNASQPNAVIGLQGIPWQDGIYLVPTSGIDGRRRWETIILLLARKISDDQVRKAFLALHSAQEEK